MTEGEYYKYFDEERDNGTRSAYTCFFTKGGSVSRRIPSISEPKYFSLMILSDLGLLDLNVKISVCKGCFVDRDVNPYMLLSLLDGRGNAIIMKGHSEIWDDDNMEDRLYDFEYETARNDARKFASAFQSYLKWNKDVDVVTLVYDLTIKYGKELHANCYIIRLHCRSQSYKLEGTAYEPHGNSCGLYPRVKRILDQTIMELQSILSKTLDMEPADYSGLIAELGPQGQVGDDASVNFVTLKAIPPNLDPPEVQGMCSVHCVMMKLLASLLPFKTVYDIDMDFLELFALNDEVVSKKTPDALQLITEGVSNVTRIFSMNMARYAVDILPEDQAARHVCCETKSKSIINYFGNVIKKE